MGYRRRFGGSSRKPQAGKPGVKQGKGGKGKSALHRMVFTHGRPHQEEEGGGDVPAGAVFNNDEDPVFNNDEDYVLVT